VEKRRKSDKAATPLFSSPSPFAYSVFRGAALKNGNARFFHFFVKVQAEKKK
jgi:hypothetical protein